MLGRPLTFLEPELRSHPLFVRQLPVHIAIGALKPRARARDVVGRPGGNRAGAVLGNETAQEAPPRDGSGAASGKGSAALLSKRRLQLRWGREKGPNYRARDRQATVTGILMLGRYKRRLVLTTTGAATLVTDGLQNENHSQCKATNLSGDKRG